MPKTVKFSREAQEALLRGLEPLARAVKVTLGPTGRSVILEKKWGSPTVTKDGAMVAKEIDFEEPEANIGAQLLKEVAAKTQKDVGDGTTTAVVLAECIFQEGMKFLAAGNDAQKLAGGIRAATNAVAEHLTKTAKPITGADDTKAVATSAANNNPAVGSLVAEAFEKVGKDGVITIEETEGMEMSWTWAEGMEFDRGYASPYFITDAENLLTELDNPHILVHEDKISSLQPLIPLLEKVHESGRPLLIIAEVVEGEALTALVMNHINGVLRSCAVKAPGFGDRRKAMLQDIAILTGARAIMKDIGEKLENLTLDALGSAKHVTVSKDNCTLVGGADNPDDVAARVAQLKAEYEESDSSYDREKLQERIAKLAGGVARIDVGAATETATKELKALVEDAAAATRAALEEGVVEGGGTALLRSAGAVNSLALTGEAAIGADIILRALKRPLHQIAENTGHSGDIVVDRVQGAAEGQGFNALTGKYENLVECGILDAVKVVRTALQNASSLATLMLTCDALIAEIPEKDKGPGMPDMDDYDY
ncbi:MAG: chaperonin GroEL [Planctomycetota bacterium]|nr:MAG: chaperonin GroEL [Planctomycetota bacterium]